MIGLIMLVVLVVYLLVTIAVTRWIVRIPKRASRKLIVGLVSLAVFALIPTWDMILGRMYFNRLCETEVGVQVYETVELDPKYFQKYAEPNFFSSKSPNYFFKDHSLDEFFLENRYVIERERNRQHSELFNIAKRSYFVIDRKTDQTLGSETYFVYFGGWLVNKTGLVVTGETCPLMSLTYPDSFLKLIFKPSN